ncbi:MAG TPA: hypothetical protein VEY12_04365 [Thermoplasmata archaeon]|nr:hypothetical protein [Thermoplasmata archaeon]
MSDVVQPPPGRQTYDRLLMHCRYKRGIILSGEWDNWTAVTGAEGSGKSTLAITAAAYTDPTFIRHWQERIAYTAEEFTAIVEFLVDRKKRAMSVILDEAMEAWFSQEWATAVQRALTKLSVQIRYAGLDVYLCSPTLKMLGAGAVRRCRDWFYCELKGGLERGFCTVYRAVENPFQKFRTTYFAPMFYHRFEPLPPWLYEKYKVFKIKEARERLADYAAIARGEQPARKAKPPTPTAPVVSDGDRIAAVVEQVLGRGDLLKLRNERGTISAEVLAAYFPDLGRDRSRVAAQVLRERLKTLPQVRHEEVVKERKEDGA